ncbi:MAG: hypothetical protein LBG59_05940 [Candidatus Peribacteria bacterium]|nr:hypothetical protein [Candidatus Peribacteria bacterium]
MKADFSSSLPTKEITGTIIALDDEYLINAQMFYDFLIQLVGLPLAVEELNLDLSTSGNVIGYTTLKNHQISHHRTLNYRSSTHTFTTTLAFSPNELKIELFNVRPLDITQSSSDISLVITLQPHNSQLYKLIVVREQEKKVVRSLNTDIVLLPLNEGEGLEITFN